MSPDGLASLLAENRPAIVDYIDAYYESTREKNSPEVEVVHPSIYTVSLGSSALALSGIGSRNPTRVHRYAFETSEQVHPYWDAVQSAGFTPEVRSGLGPRKEKQNAWLLLRNPDRDPTPISSIEQMPVALGLIESAEMKNAKQLLAIYAEQKNRAGYTDALREYERAAEKPIQRQLETFGREAYTTAQIGLIIKTSQLRLQFEGDEFRDDPHGYLECLIDASDSAHYSGFDDIDEPIKAEMDRLNW